MSRAFHACFNSNIKTKHTYFKDFPSLVRTLALTLDFCQYRKHEQFFLSCIYHPHFNDLWVVDTFKGSSHSVYCLPLSAAFVPMKCGTTTTAHTVVQEETDT